jgi:DNA-binding transcriptional ArsR family regulator
MSIQHYQSLLESEFRRRGILTAKELASSLGVSQPTISRLLARAEGHRILRLGHGRRSRYAATRDLLTLGSSWPLYEIDKEGRAQSVGQLHALVARQWCLQQDTPWESLRGNDFQDGLYPGFPWFLDDLRPQGFLGRAFARTHGLSLGLPADPRDWQPDDVVLSLLRYGQDLPGSFVLGDATLTAVQERLLSDGLAVSATLRIVDYPVRADSILGGEWAGSSAAGEQPKFTAVVRDEDGSARHVLVKFNGRAGRPEDVRWGDLLAAEHMAATLLAEHGMPAAQTALIDSGGRRFLESTRFDRIGLRGRRGTVSLAALDAAFFGLLQTPWTSAAERLHRGGWLSVREADQLKRLWWFGNLIGNTDMHYGNVSLFLDRALPLSLAPSYDMLPMFYRPDLEGRLPERSFMPQPPSPEALPFWAPASAMAEAFWTRVASASTITEPFKRIAAENAGQVSRYRRQFI